MKRRSLLAAAGALAILGLRCAVGDEVAPPEPNTYRLENYRAPTPKTLTGARVLTTDEAEALWKAGAAVFVDVLPHAPRPANLPPGTIWREKTHMNIPGSYWLPDTGYGELAPSMEAYSRAYGLTYASSFTTLLNSLARSKSWKLIYKADGTFIYELPVAKPPQQAPPTRKPRPTSPTRKPRPARSTHLAGTTG